MYRIVFIDFCGGSGQLTKYYSSLGWAKRKLNKMLNSPFYKCAMISDLDGNVVVSPTSNPI